MDGGPDATPPSDDGAAFEAATGVGGEASASLSQWYEAEAVPPNLLTGGVNIATCAGTAQYGRGANCAVDALKEGALCCSAGKVAVNLLGRLPARLEFHSVTVPNDGSYDVTWWYHCGANDYFGDRNCGGLHYPVGATTSTGGSSCRPHVIEVNGVAMTTQIAGATAQYYQFPCYQGDWSIIHAAHTTLPLKTGSNTIAIHPPQDPVLDGADIDAIHVTGVGQGIGLGITPVVSPR